MEKKLPARKKDSGCSGERKGKRIGESDRSCDRPRPAIPAIQLPEDSLISERVERVVRKSTTPVGIISSRYGTSSWQVGALGNVKWIVSVNQLPARREHDPPWFKTYEPNKLEAVEVIVIDGSWDRLLPLMWKLRDLQDVVWVKEMKEGRRRQRRNGKKLIPEGWMEKRRHRCHHNDIGGVINGFFDITMFARNAAMADWSLPSTVAGTLRDALDPIVTGFYSSSKLPAPAAGEIGSYRGLLDWKKRHTAIIAPTVFHDGGLRRNMKQNEGIG